MTEGDESGLINNENSQRVSKEVAANNSNLIYSTSSWNNLILCNTNEIILDRIFAIGIAFTSDLFYAAYDEWCCPHKKFSRIQKIIFVDYKRKN